MMMSLCHPPQTLLAGGIRWSKGRFPCIERVRPIYLKISHSPLWIEVITWPSGVVGGGGGGCVWCVVGPVLSKLQQWSPLSPGMTSPAAPVFRLSCDHRQHLHTIH